MTTERQNSHATLDTSVHLRTAALKTTMVLWTQLLGSLCVRLRSLGLANQLFAETG